MSSWQNRAMPSSRDPVSELFDQRARQLIDRAMARKGEWHMVRISDPGIRTRTQFAARGIDLSKPDNGGLAVGGSNGGKNAKTRWLRGLTRACYYQWKWYSQTGGGWRAERRRVPRDTSALRFEVGRRLPPSPQYDPANPRAGGLPPGYAFRVKIDRGGKAKMAAVQRLSDRDRIYTDQGDAGRRWADQSKRDWA